MEDKIVVLKSYETAIEAGVDKDVLTQNEIQSYLDDDLINQVLPMLSQIDGGCFILYIFERDRETALKTLAEFHEQADLH
jgi:hypothetical protein